jgi:hypothetical protein
VRGREAFFLEDGILLLEGQEDVQYLPRAYQDLALENKAQLFGWGAGSASKMEIVAAILADLGFERVAGLSGQ